MPDARSPIQHHLVLHRIDPEQGVRRCYSLMIKRYRFRTIRLARNWGRIGTNGQERVKGFATEAESGEHSRPPPGRRGGLARSPK